MDYSPPGSSVHGILQARILEWVAMPFSKGSSWPRSWTHVFFVYCIGRRVLYHWATREVLQEIWKWDRNVSVLSPTREYRTDCVKGHRGIDFKKDIEDWDFPGGTVNKNPPVNAIHPCQEMQVQSLGWKDLLEKGMAIHSSILAWRIPWTEEPGRLQSMRSQRVRRNW